MIWPFFACFGSLSSVICQLIHLFKPCCGFQTCLKRKSENLFRERSGRNNCLFLIWTRLSKTFHRWLFSFTTKTILMPENKKA